MPSCEDREIKLSIIMSTFTSINSLFFFRILHIRGCVNGFYLDLAMFFELQPRQL